MSLVTVHGSNTMYVESEEQDPAGPVYTVVTAGAPGSFSGDGSEDPTSLPELREFSTSADFAGGDTSAWTTGQYVEITTAGGNTFNYYWDGDEWQSGIAP